MTRKTCESREKSRARYVRNPSSKWYRSSRWLKERVKFLARHPQCTRCGVLATHVDHRRPHRGDEKRFWDQSNWQALCHRCHSAKTCREDGGFGNDKLKPMACDQNGIPMDPAHPWASQQDD